MRVQLLHRDRDIAVEPELRDEVFEAMLDGELFALANIRRRRERAQEPAVPPLPPRYAELAQDLELDTLWGAMAGGDEFLLETARRVVLSSLRDRDEIAYRQDVLADCLAQRDLVARLYELAMEALEADRKVGTLWHNAGPAAILRRSVQVLELQVGVLQRLREVAEQHAGDVRSEGLSRFFAMVRDELNDDYLHSVEDHLRRLQFKRGLLQSAELGQGDKGRNYVVRTPPDAHWTQYLPFVNRTPGLSFTIPPRDESGFKALDELRDRGINHVADAVGRSADHVKHFFAMLRLELAFYLSCVNLHEQLEARGEPTCRPEPADLGRGALAAAGLYDVCLTFHLEDRVVGNDLDADGRSLVMITGANQGGKSTLLRSVGLAQLMMQCGMFVGAEAFGADVCTGVFTHYKREEDAALEGGKLDEELRRMSAIADAIAPGAMLLCNESFASTNEREGSEIARQVVRAMLDRQIRVVFVTHMYDLAHGFHEQGLAHALFLRPERRPGGHRTFRLLEGEPLPTSFGEESYRRIFGVSAAPALSCADGPAAGRDRARRPDRGRGLRGPSRW